MKFFWNTLSMHYIIYKAYMAYNWFFSHIISVGECRSLYMNMFISRCVWFRDALDSFSRRKKTPTKTLNQTHIAKTLRLQLVYISCNSRLVLYRLYTQTPQGRMESPALVALRERFNLGAVISGTSAGTECQPTKLMINSRHRFTKNGKCLS